MATLYVTEPGARLEKEYRRLLVVKDDEVLAAVPFARVDHVVLVGRVGTTTPALHALLDAGVGLSLLNGWGKERGRLMPPSAKNIPLRHQQYARAGDADFCLAVSKAIVGGKLRNSRAFARRIARRNDLEMDHCFTRLNDALNGLDAATSLATVRGLEGSAARAYFGLLRAAIDPAFGFEKRTRRPPKDPANALLSLGYSLLNENLMTACEVAGLDPYDGFFHADKYGRPALALDLVEEFRSVIVDSLVYGLIRRRRLTVDDFEDAAGGAVYLRRGSLGLFFRAYTDKLQSEVKVESIGRPLTYQKIFEVQARKLRAVIEGKAERYEPFRTR